MAAFFDWRQKLAQGIIGKVWNIKAGNDGRSSSAQLGDSIDYITNSEKCNLKMGSEAFLQIGRELTYITDDVKTLQGVYIGGRHILDVENAMNEMMQVKEYFKKMDGRIALHGIVSLAKEESSSDNAGKLINLLNDLMEEIFPENQVVYAVHTNTENLHVHFIANTVGLDGKKIHMDKSFMRHIFEPTLNRVAVNYGFTPNGAWKKERNNDPVSIVERKIQLRKIIDIAIEESEDFESFLSNLKRKCMSVQVGKHLSVQVKGMSRRMRTYQLGKAYTIEGIAERISSKRDPLISTQLKNQVSGMDSQRMMRYKPTSIKKYKDMSSEERREAIHLLKIGRNPWREAHSRNWQLSRISDDLDREAHVYDIVTGYSGGNGNITDAKKEIIRRQKAVSEERAIVRANIRTYKAVTDIYEDMKKYEIRSYLYEIGGYKEYQKEYEAYKKSSDRLLNHYGKTVEEVARFILEQQGALMYSKAQIEELSGQYRAILRYENRMLSKVSDPKIYRSLYETTGHSEARTSARDYGTLTTRLVYVVAKGVTDIKIRTLTTPDIVDGKATVTTTISVLSEDGQVIEEYASNTMSTRAFNQKLNETKDAYQMNKCIAYEDEEQADLYMRRQRKTESRRVK